MVKIAASQPAGNEASRMENDSFANLLNPPSEITDRSVSNAEAAPSTQSNETSHDNNNPFTDRKSISEVLHDIYDGNVQ
jgi:hypothetical protein